jgi:SLT domain-containing protein
VLNQIRTESTGDPAAINNWDSNAQRGTPSKGLVQVIDPTFRTYALPGYDQNIWDPLSNILAGVRYAIATYGSIPAGMRGVAYDSGGYAPKNGWLMPFNGLSSPEPVLTPGQWRTADSAIDTVARLANDGAVKMTVNQLPGQSAADLAREIDRRLAFAGGRSA